jgi:hypothetical protein
VPATDGFGETTSLSSLRPHLDRRGRDGQYWLVGGPDGRLPIVFRGGASAATPAAVLIPMDGDFASRAEAAMRLWRVITGRPRGAPPQPLTLQQRHRLVLALRALDGHVAGASYRVIAQVLFGHARIPAGAGWKTHELRDRTIRLVRAGLKLMRGGYLDLLRYPRARRSS